MHVFTGLVTQARTAPREESAAELLQEALDLWEAEALSGLHGRWAQSVRVQLHEERLTATLLRNEIRLRQGQAPELLPELRALAISHPLDERVAAQLITVLYECGQQAEALRLYGHVRTELATELGVDPGPDLRRLHQMILKGEPVVASLVPSLAPMPRPRQLPAPPAYFVGRTAELAALDRMAQPASTIAISALGGMGKTWLALHWAHLRLDRFPDGQLYVDLHGFGLEGEPAKPDAVVRGFLEALGVEAARVPREPEAQLGLFRSLVADRRMLIMLDDVRDTAQVAPLLRGSSEGVVITVSRIRLAGLIARHGARSLELDTFGRDEGHLLLTRLLGPARIAEEPEAARALLDHTAGLPLAVGILGARAADNPALPLAALVGELDDEAHRLHAFNAGEPSADLRSMFDSYMQALDEQTTQIFTLFGQIPPGRDMRTFAVAHLANLSTAQARTSLRILEAAYLVQQHRPDRYRMHDLVRLYAVDRGQTSYGGHAPGRCDACSACASRSRPPNDSEPGPA
ncbi:AfsR/SARP family transcriptional regulator [Nonomuraea ceibae]|uniref:AfsR/SARP family transcriptional regulator n=1 Tax=Nonomuraea ceibae TaxID=1935170 RepID=UPI001FE8378C|nr:BTAD domain-containing putative transcriptional regulator [Nonomuraea ceibae]